MLYIVVCPCASTHLRWNFKISNILVWNFILSLWLDDYGCSCAFEWNGAWLVIGNSLSWRLYSVSQYNTAYCSKLKCSPMSLSVLVHNMRYLTLMQMKNVICFVWNLNTNWPNKLMVYSRKTFREKETLILNIYQYENFSIIFPIQIKSFRCSLSWLVTYFF